nr:hypothetical protein [Micromonospora sp. DSM 115978]
MRRKLSTIGLAAAVAVAVVACGSPGGEAETTASDAPPASLVPELGPDQEVSIVFESYNFGQAGAWTDTFTELIGRFQ